MSSGPWALTANTLSYEDAFTIVTQYYQHEQRMNQPFQNRLDSHRIPPEAMLQQAINDFCKVTNQYWVGPYPTVDEVFSKATIWGMEHLPDGQAWEPPYQDIGIDALPLWRASTRQPPLPQLLQAAKVVASAQTVWAAAVSALEAEVSSWETPPTIPVPPVPTPTPAQVQAPPIFTYVPTPPQGLLGTPVPQDSINPADEEYGPVWEYDPVPAPLTS